MGKQGNSASALATGTATTPPAVTVPIASAMTDLDLFKNGLALLAFVMAFYALAARERKTPYIVTFVYETSLLVLFALLISFVGKAMSALRTQTLDTMSGIAAALLVMGLISAMYRVWRVKNIHTQFRDDTPSWNIRALMSRVRRWFRSSNRRYENNPERPSPEFIAAISDARHLPKDAIKAAIERQSELPVSLSVVCKVSDHELREQVLVDLIVRFIRMRRFVQYTSCSRHPIELLTRLQEEWRTQNIMPGWNEAIGYLVLIDAYTPHFGFADTIHIDHAARARQNCLQYILSRPSFAGIHSASAEAFNAIKAAVQGKEKDKSLRDLTLVIYEDTHAVIDLESADQYRIFLRHVVPSERLWGGMFTFFIEAMIPDDAQSIFDSLADVSCILPIGKKGT